VTLGREAVFATRATIGDSPELYHLSADRPRRDDEIDGALAPPLQTLRPLLRVEWHDALAAADRTAGRRDLNPVRNPQVPSLPTPTFRIPAPLPRLKFFRSHAYVTLLVVEISPFVYNLEVGISEFRPSARTCQLVQLCNGCHA